MSNLVFSCSHVTFSPVSCFTCSTSSFAFVERASRVTKTPTGFLGVDAGRLDTFAERSFDPLQRPRINAVGVGVSRRLCRPGRFRVRFPATSFH